MKVVMARGGSKNGHLSFKNISGHRILFFRTRRGPGQSITMNFFSREVLKKYFLETIIQIFLAQTLLL